MAFLVNGKHVVDYFCGVDQSELIVFNLLILFVVDAVYCRTVEINTATTAVIFSNHFISSCT